MSSTTEVGARASANGFVRRTHGMAPEEIAAGWSCKKRDGTVVPFDCGKVRKALYRCFNALNPDALASDVNGTEHLVEEITRKVVNSIAAQKETCPDVETVQRYVIQQLWGEGLFDAAEHYQDYRETHRKKRAVKAVDPAIAARVAADQKHFPTDLQYYQLMAKFSRWLEAEKRRETWQEVTYDRVMPWLRSLPGAKLTEPEWRELSDAMYNLEASPAMRVVQMAGPALDRCNVGAYNCAYAPADNIAFFPEMLYILMQGTGEGFSCESEYVDELPRIKRQRGLAPETVVIEDDTESWCEGYHTLLQRLWDGHDAVPDVTRVRKKGARLKTKGGRSSGPEPFVELWTFARNLVKARQGRFLEDHDVHRLACFTGKIVQVGGVRRAAELSLSDLVSQTMRTIKSGQWWANGAGLWIDGKYLSMANNSAVYDFDGDVPVETFMAEWLSLVESKSGERGVFNRRAALKHRPKRRKAAKFGCNPCAEIILRPHQFCNLSIAVARPDDTVESLKRKVRLAAVFGKVQSLATKFRYIRDDWRKNCEEERLLGVDITGHADCPLLRHGAPGRAELIRMLNKVVEDVDAELSTRFGVNRSAANTTIKPGGDSAVFFDCASGVSPRYAQYQIRWVREPRDTPVAKFLIASGVPYAEAPESPELLVFGFPKSAPIGSTLRDDMTAEEQFFNWLEWKTNWAEHSVSATIYVEPHEWPKLGGLVYDHIDHITGLSFLPKDNGTYRYAPNEELSKAQYDEYQAKFPDLNWAKLVEYEDDDNTGARTTMACVGGSCD
jgi:ribonucleoside-triphosphate reductase